MLRPARELLQRAKLGEMVVGVVVLFADANGVVAGELVEEAALVEGGAVGEAQAAERQRRALDDVLGRRRRVRLFAGSEVFGDGRLGHLRKPDG